MDAAENVCPHHKKDHAQCMQLIVVVVVVCTIFPILLLPIFLLRLHDHSRFYVREDIHIFICCIAYIILGWIEVVSE